jgi:hypothetical protein
VNDNAGHLPQTSGAFFRLYSASSQHVLDALACGQPISRVPVQRNLVTANGRSRSRSSAGSIFVTRQQLGHRISTSRPSVAISPNVLKGSEWSLRQG